MTSNIEQRQQDKLSGEETQRVAPENAELQESVSAVGTEDHASSSKEDLVEELQLLKKMKELEAAEISVKLNETNVLLKEISRLSQEENTTDADAAAKED